MKYNDSKFMGRWLAICMAALPALLFAAEPQLGAKSAILMDEKSGVILFGKDIHAIRYPASTTKILTAILLLEHTAPDEMIYAPADVEHVEGASLHLKPGECLTAADLLKAMLLRSANDACHALAVHVAGSDIKFAELMNAKAKELGCLHSHFMAPHGLHNDKHYTTAYDLALIAREAMKYPEIRSLVSIRRQTINRSINTKDTLLISKNKWLDHDKSADGIKTGYTKVARATFVGSATRNGYRFISVILQSEEWEKDQTALMNYGFANYERSVAYLKGTQFGQVEVTGGNEPTVNVKVNADVHYAHAKGSKPELNIILRPTQGLSAPIALGQEVGMAEILDAKGWKKVVPVFAMSEVSRSFGSSLATLTIPAMAIMLGGASLAMRNRARKMSQSVVRKG